MIRNATEAKALTEKATGSLDVGDHIKVALQRVEEAAKIPRYHVTVPCTGLMILEAKRVVVVLRDLDFRCTYAPNMRFTYDISGEVQIVGDPEGDLGALTIAWSH